MNEVARVNDKGNKEKMAKLSPNEEASDEMIPLNQLKETVMAQYGDCLLYTSPSPRDLSTSRMPSSA